MHSGQSPFFTLILPVISGHGRSGLAALPVAADDIEEVAMTAGKVREGRHISLP